MGKRTKDAWLPGLRRAMATRAPVRLTRHIPGADVIQGYVVGIGRKWVLLANLDSLRIDGYIAVRLTDIARLQPRRTRVLTKKVVRARNTWPPAAPTTAVDLDTTRRLIATAHEHATLVVLHPEREDPDVAFVGVPSKYGPRSLWLTEITPKAKWNGSISEWKFAEITRVEFSGSYEKDLLLVGGPPPRTPKK